MTTRSRRSSNAPLGAILLALAVLFSVTACKHGRGPDEVYEAAGVRFEHPDGWKLSKESVIEGTTNMTVFEGPDHELIEIFRFAGASPITLEEFAAAVASKRGEKVGEKLSVAGVAVGSEGKMATAPAEATIAHEPTKGVRQNFAISVLGVATPHTSEFFMKPMGGRKVVIITQSADEHLRAARADWQKMFDSLTVSH